MTGNEDKRTGAQEWGDILREIGQQVRREAARLAKVDDDADWDTIGKGYSDAVRKSTARSAGLDESAEWKTIGERIEQEARSGTARVVGEQPDADWKDIGQSVDEKVRSFIDELFTPKSKPSSSTETDTETLGSHDEPIDPWA